MSQKELLGKYSMDTIASCAFGVDSQAFTNKGRAHDMFSQIFWIWIYKFFHLYFSIETEKKPLIGQKKNAFLSQFWAFEKIKTNIT